MPLAGHHEKEKFHIKNNNNKRLNLTFLKKDYSIKKMKVRRQPK